MIALPLQLNENPVYVWYLSLESQFKVEKESSIKCTVIYYELFKENQ